MRIVVVMSMSFALIFLGRNAWAEKRDTFQTSELTGSFSVKEDWFGNTNKTRKQIELDKEKKQQEAMKAETERRKKYIEKVKAQEAATKVRATNTTPKIVTRSKKDSETQRLQEKQALRTRAGNYPPAKKEKLTTNQK